MNLDVRGIQAFVAVAQRGGFQRAADHLHISQTALTRRLQNLEASLGVILVERTTRSVSLTAIGREFLPRAERLISELTAALAEIRENGRTRRGDVTVACIPTAGVRYLPTIISEYAAQYPDNQVKILDDRLSSGVTEAVLRREAEFGINVVEAPHPDLISIPLLKDRYVLICRDDHPLADRRRLPWRDLARWPLIVPGRASANRKLLDLAVMEHNLRLRPMFEVQRSATMLGLVAAGVAAAIVPELAMQPDAYKRIRTLDLTGPALFRTIVLICRKGAQHSPAASALFELIKKRVAAGR
jgi:DNA-binding transcriptional LysR family regulator